MAQAHHGFAFSTSLRFCCTVHNMHVMGGLHAYGGMLIFPAAENTSELFFRLLMASSDVDQKFLGRYAKSIEKDNVFLSSMLYKILGLSVLLSKKLVRARRLRRLDTTRDTKSLQLYHHIIWLSREGLVIVEQYILPMVTNYVELKVLAYKLRASFYHIFVLFHNQPSVNQAAVPSFTDVKGKGVDRGSLRASPLEDDGSFGPQSMLPPGLAPVSVPKSAATFLLPAIDYVPTATQCFTIAITLAEELLSGSHPLRLSVKVEYAAYLYDCIHDTEGSHLLAQQSIRDVYNAQEGMDDDTFDDATELVAILAKMMRRGRSSSETTSAQGSSSQPGTPAGRRQGKKDAKSLPPLPSPSPARRKT